MVRAGFFFFFGFYNEDCFDRLVILFNSRICVCLNVLLELIVCENAK